MIFEGVYMAIVKHHDEELFIDECESLLVRGWEFHGTVMATGQRWMQVFKVPVECDTDARNPNP